MPARSWPSWSTRFKPPICLGRSEEALAEPARASLPFKQCLPKKFLERLTICSLVGLTWQGHAPKPPKSCQAFKAPLSPGGALLFGHAAAIASAGANIRREPGCAFELHPIVTTESRREEAAMLQRTPRDALQENQETGFRRIIRTFDPEVPGYFFWPINFRVPRSCSKW